MEVIIVQGGCTIFSFVPIFNTFSYSKKPFCFNHHQMKWKEHNFCLSFSVITWVKKFIASHICLGFLTVVCFNWPSIRLAYYLESSSSQTSFSCTRHREKCGSATLWFSFFYLVPVFTSNYKSSYLFLSFF